MRTRGATERRDFLAEAMEANPYEQRRRRLFECGEVVGLYGDYADVRVGYDAEGQPLVLEEVHVISGYRPEPGTWVALRYLNGHPGEPIVVGPALTAAEPPDTEQSPAEVVSARSSSHFGAYASLDGRLEAAEGGLLGKFDPSSGHTHSSQAGQGPKLAQACSHQQADTDASPTALHHTLGTGGNQAAAGSHSHSGLVTYSSAAPKAPWAPGQPGSGTPVARWDHRHPNLAWILEQTFERVLKGVLDTKTATPSSVTYTFGNAVTDNNGIATWYGMGWASLPGYRSTGNPNDYFEMTFRSAGTNSIVLNRGVLIPAHPEHHAVVLLDGQLHGTWDQSNPTYTLSSVAAGIHTVRVVRDAQPDNENLTIGSLQLYALPYQGVGVSGDVFTILAGLPYVLVYTLGIGPANNGATRYSTEYAPALSPKLPMGSYNNDTALARDVISVSGWGISSAAAMINLPSWDHSSGSFLPFTAGLALSLSGTAATRGWRIIPTGINYILGTPYLGTSIIWAAAWAAVVQVTVPGSGSVFAAGDLALLVATRSPGPPTTAPQVLTGDTPDRAGDLFKIPTDLY